MNPQVPLIYPTAGPQLAAVLAALLAGGSVSAAAPPSVPLADRAKPAGDSGTAPPPGPRFERVDPVAAGLTFGSGWKPGAGYRLRLYQSVPGGGVCIGDFDADGWPDVFLSQPNVGSGLYRNRGGFEFEDVTARSGLPEMPDAQGAAFADIDGDGDLDLFVCNDGRPNQLFTNRGDGSFEDTTARSGLGFAGASVMMAFADYDRDGDLDGYLVTYRQNPPAGANPAPAPGPEGKPVVRDGDSEFIEVITPADGRPRVVLAAQRDRLYRNNGDGTFVEVSTAAGIAGSDWGLAATWWDYDRDGWPDLYVSNDFYSPDRLYRNNRDGTFTDVAAEALPHTPWYSMGADTADLDNDGWPELMASDMSGSTHYKQKASMGDMGDTAWFLVHPVPRQYMRNTLYGNTGTGRFTEAAALAGVADTDWTWSVKFADLDEDGWTDLYVTNGMNRDWTNSDLRKVAESAPTPEATMQVWLGSPMRDDPNAAFRNLPGDLRFEDVSGEWGLGEEIVSYGAAFSDLDRDGDLDLVVNNAEGPPGLFRNNTAGTHRVLLRLEGADGNRWGIGATVAARTASGQQLRFLNAAQGYMSSNEPLVHFGLGGEPSIERLEVRWPSGAIDVIEDLEADRFYTVREGAAGPPAPSRDRNDGPPPAAPLFAATHHLEGLHHRETPFNDFVRQPLLPNQHSQLGPGMAWGDPDGDGDPDVFLGGGADHPGQLWINDGAGAFAPAAAAGSPWTTDASCEDMGALFFDADSDGDADLYVVSGGVECEPGDDLLRDRLYLNSGGGHFVRAEPGALPDLRDSGGPVAAADYDRDGDLDLFVGGRVVPGRYPLTPASRLLRNDGGRFTDVTGGCDGLGATGMATAALWSDTDADGWPDLLVAHEWGPVKLFRNGEGQLADATAGCGLDKVTGWFNSLSAGDFDRDGDSDYVVGNWGLNTKYHANDEHPALLYYGDFGGDGEMQLVEAEYEDETLFPVRGKSCSTNAMPFLAERFTKFHDFAIASLGEIYTEPALTDAHRFAANTLPTGVLFNRGEDGFEFVELPVAAQLAPVFGSSVWDANLDGYLDVFLAQNFFGPQAETGNADGGVGVLLLGDGSGGFEPLAARDSGIVVSGDAGATALVDLDADGAPELVVATNDGPVLTFARNGRAVERGGGGELRLRLRGRPGNPDAIGARATAVHTDSQLTVVEAAAGAGYQSAGPAELVMPARTRGLATVRVEIRWPDGSLSEAVPGEGAVVEIAQPAAP